MMLYYIFLFICVCGSSVVMSMPGGYRGDSNKKVSYNFPFISRRDWHARDPIETEPLKTPVPYVVIHHTYTPAACFDLEQCSASMRKMQYMHIDINGWWDIGYNFCVGSDGAVYEGRGWNKLGAHALHFNSVSIGICLIGDWRYELPPPKQLEVAKTLIAVGVKLGSINPDYKLVGHRQVRATECPGEALFTEIQSWDQYSPFPRSSKDLLNVTELSDIVKEQIRGVKV